MAAALVSRQWLKQCLLSSKKKSKGAPHAPFAPFILRWNHHPLSKPSSHASARARVICLSRLTHRNALFDDAFLRANWRRFMRPLSLVSQPPIPPAQLALATIVQAYTGVSDDEVIEATLMDRRWQLVLDCLDTEQAP